MKNIFKKDRLYSTYITTFEWSICLWKCCIS